MKTKELFKRTLLVLMALLGTLTASAQAPPYSFTANNADGKLIYYLITDTEAHTVDVSNAEGYGSVYDNYGYLEIPSTVEHEGILYTVTGIGHHAFVWTKNLSSVSLPNTIITIKQYAFGECHSLASIELPESVEQIEDYAFSNCSCLTSVTMGNHLTSIGIGAFKYCSLTSIIIPRSVTSIGDMAFFRCGNLKTIVSLAQNPPIIDDYTFPDCIFQTLCVPGGCLSLYAAADYWKYFGTIVENSRISFDDAQVEAICVNNWDSNGDGHLDRIEAALVTDLGTAFQGKTQITSFNELQYFSGLTSLAVNAFKNCSSLSAITLPASLTTIGSSAFMGCGTLASVGNLHNVTTMGESAFQNCTSLTQVNINSTSIESNTFAGCTSLTTVTLGSSVADIKEGAFRNCTALTSIDIPGSVKTISGGFEGCSSLASVTLHSGTKYFLDAVFKNCSSLKSITLPSSLVHIGVSAFEGTGLTAI